MESPVPLSSKPSDTDPIERYGLRRRGGLFGGITLFVAMCVIPAPTGLDSVGWYTAAVGLLMAIWWMTEALPIPATALLPIVIFPMFGILSVGETTAPYANPLIFLFLGGFLLALGMERWGLHRRIALTIIRGIGTQPRRIVAGFMAASAFLSLWISNTATAMMMLPIGLSIVALVDRPERPGQETNFAVVLMLAIAYACSIGGMGTLIGSPTNAVLAGFMDVTYEVEIAFWAWMALGLPLAVVGLIVTYVVLTHFVFPIRIQTIPGGRGFIDAELSKLGRMNRGERIVAVVFALTALLWITRPLLGVPGLSDTGIALFGALLLFVIPVDWSAGVFVLDWSSARRLPWGVLLLFGGGLSLAAAVEATGLAQWIGAAMSGLSTWPELVIVLLVVTVIILLTELTSNTATAAAFLPVLASLASTIGLNPLHLLLPATLAASCAFMLPVATPPNAIVYGSSFVTIPQMARAGLWLNVVFILLVTLMAYTLLPVLVDAAFTSP